ncbi:MAG TPA: tetratricopeptide repeat protein [Opitutaceae bacterium]|nr:tetratricopeptide repeat protein [Opitutaceae bacterium]
MPDQSAPPPSRARTWWTAALILVLALACYWPALRGGLVWDDDAHVTRPGLQSVAGLWRIWSDPRATQQYYPLLHTAFWVEHRLWGGATLGYHLTNVLLHAASAVLLVLALGRLGVAGARLAGILFAVHPVCVESVAWISEQKNTLSLVFYLLSALAYLRFEGDRGKPASTRAYLLASFLFVLALLTKTVTATLPAALLVILWWRRGRLSWRRDVLPLVPWFVLAVASGIFTAVVERELVGAQGAPFDLTPVQRLLLAGRVVWFYLGKLAWPADLIFVYPRWDAGSAAGGWAAYLVAAALVTAALWLLRGRSRGPLAAWLFFVGSLFPALGFLNVYPFIFSYVADHFQYLASMGIFAAGSAGAAGLLGRAPRPVRAAGWGIVSFLVAALAVLSRAQSRTYADQRTLYETTIERNPECWMAHNNLGLWDEDRGDLEGAVAQYRETLRIKGDIASVHNNLGGILRTMPGGSDEAFAHIQEALRLLPDFAEAHNNLGVWYGDRGDSGNAIAQYGEALRLKPDYAEAHNNLGSVLAANGRLDEAIGHFQEALRLLPGFAEAHNNLGNAWLSTPGRLNDAIAQYQEALRSRPGFGQAHKNLGNALLRVPDRLGEAVAQFEEALRSNPDDAEAHNNLGLALNGQGRTQEALAQYEEALRLMPRYAEIRINIALALLRLPGRENESAAQLEEFLRVRPGNEAATRILAKIRATQP